MYRLVAPSQAELEKFFNTAKKTILDRIDDWLSDKILDVKVPCRSKKLNLTAKVTLGSLTDVFLRQYNTEAGLKNLMLGDINDFLRIINDLESKAAALGYPEDYVFSSMTLKQYETYENGGNTLRVAITRDIDHFNTILTDVFLHHGYDGEYADHSKVFDKSRFVNLLNLRICPYCGRAFIYSVQQVGSKTVVKPQIDHFLPKSKYPFLALSFMNLIPSCQTCNMKDCKGNNDPVKFAPTGVQYLIQYPYQFDASKIEFKYVLNGTSYNKDDNFDVEVDYKGDKELKKGYNNYLKTEEFYKCHNVEVAGMYRQMMILASKAKFFYEKMGMRKFWLQPTPMLLMGYNFSEESSGKNMLYKFKHDIYLQMMNGEVGKIFKMK